MAMVRTTSETGRERLPHLTVALVTELGRPTSGGSNQDMAEHALRIDELADDLLAADGEGAVLFLAGVVTKMLDALCAKTGEDRGTALERFVFDQSGSSPE
jgi:hypothetical protein